MDGEGPSPQRNAFRDTCSGSSPVFGRFSVGVGSSPPRSDCVRGLVGPGEFTAHQYPGNEGFVFGPAVIPEDNHRPSSDSDVRQLDGSVSHSMGWEEVSFGFVAKTQDHSSLDPRFESFTVPALPKSSNSPNGRLLCPVRVVKCYLARTTQHRPRCERLFVTSGRIKKEISKNTVSFWLRKVISLAYQLLGKTLPVPSPLARETRGIAPSSFQEELCCQPGSEGGYLASSHHLHAPLPQRLVPQVPRHLPPGFRGGSAGHGITCPLTPEYLT